MTYRAYVVLMSDLMNTLENGLERSRLMRGANRELYKECVGGTAAEADMALAEAMVQRREEPHERIQDERGST